MVHKTLGHTDHTEDHQGDPQQHLHEWVNRDEEAADGEDEARSEAPTTQTNVSGVEESLAQSHTLMRQLHPRKYSDLSLASQQLDKTLFLNIS